MKFNNIDEFKEHFNKMNPTLEERKENIRKYWLELKEFKKEEDIPNIPIAGNMFTQDEIDKFFLPILIKNGAIIKDHLKDNTWYYGNHRNCNVAKWNVEENKFEHLRFKFGYRWDKCNHFQDDDGFALFVPIREANLDEVNEQNKIIGELRKV